MIGQESIIEILKKSVKKNNYSSAYLFSGPTGVGKTTLGRIFSKAILCNSPIEGNPCNSCESCSIFDKEQHFSYKEIDAATYGSKEDMVNLRDDASYLPIGKKKIILIDECQDISKQGQDSLLKQIEPCPEHLVYMFCTTSPEKMLETIRKRCMELHVSKINSSLITQRLSYICTQESLKYTPEALEMISEKSGGHVRNAIGLIEELAYIGDITVDNLNIVYRDYDEEIGQIICNLGLNLNKIIELYNFISSNISVTEFYNIFLSLINDSVKLLCGYDNYSEKRKKILINIKNTHGNNLIEFLNYIITRDKFVDKIGLQGDLIILHYKFNTESFLPRVQKETVPQIPQSKSPPESTTLTYRELSKLPEKERCEILRNQRNNQKKEVKEMEEIVPSKWPLPKEERPGISFEESEMSPQDFSKGLVGGRGGNQSMVDT